MKQDFEQNRLRDALSEVTRKERRLLLGTSLLGIALVKAGPVPSKLSGLGVELQIANQRALLVIVASIILYFLGAFIIYAASDFLIWYLAINKQATDRAVSNYEEDLRGYYPQPGTLEEELEKYKVELHKKYSIYFKLVSPAMVIRALFDFVLPIVVGGYGLLVIAGVVVCGI